LSIVNQHNSYSTSALFYTKTFILRPPKDHSIYTDKVNMYGIASLMSIKPFH